MRLLRISNLSTQYQSNKTHAQHKRLVSARLTAIGSDRQLFIASSHFLVTLAKSQQKPTRTEASDKRWVLDTGRWGKGEREVSLSCRYHPHPTINRLLKGGRGEDTLYRAPLPSRVPIARVLIFFSRELRLTG